MEELQTTFNEDIMNELLEDGIAENVEEVDDNAD